MIRVGLYPMPELRLADVLRGNQVDPLPRHISTFQLIRQSVSAAREGMMKSRVPLATPSGVHSPARSITDLSGQESLIFASIHCHQHQA